MATSVATMALPSPGPSNRPAYMDNLFREGSHSINKTPSLRSAHSSISSTASSTDLRGQYSHRRPPILSPAYEEDDQDDRSSVRSLKRQFKPRSSFRSLFNRRTYPQVKEIVDVQFPTKSSSTPHSPDRSPSSRAASRRPSLPTLQPSQSSPLLQEVYASKPLPVAPSRQAEELRCQPCYYYAARHCNGYVWGGQHGDACEHCLAAGFFGAS